MKALAPRSPKPTDALPKIFLTPGTLYCTPEPAVVTTVLGSCVAVCLWDRTRGGAGMNHYVLPHGEPGEHGLRYGDVAIAQLGEGMTRLGSRIENLRAKVFGGAAVLPFGVAADTVGSKNVRVALEWLKRHSIPVVARRTGGKNGLLIRLYTRTGRVMVRKIPLGASIRIGERVPSHDSRYGLLAERDG
jgi:chemotaxis protein CheD